MCVIHLLHAGIYYLHNTDFSESLLESAWHFKEMKNLILPPHILSLCAIFAYFNWALTGELI